MGKKEPQLFQIKASEPIGQERSLVYLYLRETDILVLTGMHYSLDNFAFLRSKIAPVLNVLCYQYSEVMVVPLH